jgi:hypothetical protein
LGFAAASAGVRARFMILSRMPLMNAPEFCVE